MPRQARRKSESGVYHIILRGANQETIFHDDEDNRKFLYVLSYYKSVCNYKILAYCLMKNHVHILIKEEGEELPLIMKRIAGKYVYWYNAKYNRIGHLFQDRYRSEPVEDDEYFLTVLRYIHQNPLKAKVVKEISEYPYNSYNEYISEPFLADTEFVFGMLDKDDFVEFHSYLPEEECLEIKPSRRIVTDEMAKIIAEEFTQNLDISSVSKDEKINLARSLKSKGLSTRQITELTPITRRLAEFA